jgi:hypothetical protein
MSTPPTPPTPTPNPSHDKSIIVAVIGGLAIIIAALIGIAKIPTLTPSSTPVPTSISSPEQQYLRIIKTPPTLMDSLNVQDSNAWDEPISKDGSSGCAFKDGQYHAFMAQRNIVECLAKGVLLSNNFVYQVRINIQQGDGGGIIFGSPPSNGSMKYRFYINTGSYCDVFNPFVKDHPLFRSSHAPISSNSTLIAVMVISDTIYLFINKKYVGSFHTIDNGPLSGQIGVFGAEVNKSTDVFFDQLSVWQI